MQAKNGDTVIVHYICSSSNDEILETTVGRRPIQFTVGRGQILSNIDQALVGMHLGELKTIKVPHELFKKIDSKHPLFCQDMIFNIQLLNIVDNSKIVNISEDYKCIFVHIPRTAGTSIKEALELLGRGHPTWDYFNNNYPDKWKTYVKFAVVRNPWARAVSAYSYARMDQSYWHNLLIDKHPDYEILKNKSFLECCHLLNSNRNLLKHESWYPQYLWVANEVNKKISLMVDHILSYENLTDDFRRLGVTLGIRNIALPKFNASNHNIYSQYYTEETKEIIENIYSDDIKLFKYEFK